MLTPPSSEEVTKYSGKMHENKNLLFTGVPFLILGRKVFNCQHGIDRTAGEKRKRKDAEEVLYIIISFYPQPLCFCQLWLANSKGQIHEWVI